ncbi:AAA family ATPase [Amycolatopsis nigrescens]|uniref:AAA family ATPase n=1 Tax=Amycolatopsis nigrescens TaxID=381445 RepID=UPI0003690B79|nr:AAA family ATPase [Amycolatopsis nigrescens]
MTRPTPQHRQAGQLQLTVEPRALLVIAGLPGAGKSTLLRNTRASAPIDVLDTDQVRARLRARLPANTPYGWYRPLVHLLHAVRVLRALVRAPGPVVLHDPATGAGTRAVLVLLGALTGRPRHLLWIDCSPTEALIGQRSRGRVLLGWSFSRHARRAPRFRARLAAGRPPRGWLEASMADRAEARDGLHLRVGG